MHTYLKDAKLAEKFWDLNCPENSFVPPPDILAKSRGRIHIKHIVHLIKFCLHSTGSFKIEDRDCKLTNEHPTYI